MMVWIVRLLQIAGPVWGTLVFVWDIYLPMRQYQAGEVRATWDGFYQPLVLNLVTCLLSFSVTFVAPQWRPLLLWIREHLPAPASEVPMIELTRLIQEAFLEKQDNGLKGARNLMAQLNGATDRESVATVALERLQGEFQRILAELKGGAA